MLDAHALCHDSQISNRSTWKRPPQPVLVPLGTQPAPAPQAATGAAATNAVHPQPPPLAPPPLEGRRTAAGGPPNAAYADTPQAAVPGPGTGSGPGPGAAPGTVWVWAVPGEAAAERVMPSRALLLQGGCTCGGLRQMAGLQREYYLVNHSRLWRYRGQGPHTWSRR